MTDDNSKPKVSAIVKMAAAGAVTLISVSIAGAPAVAVTFDDQGRAVISGTVASKFLPPDTIVGGPSLPEDNGNCNCNCNCKPN
jgi:hypothetical protein